ncbi:hypothetical protein RFI_11778 [Reticulomyxa filosa]|uniref:Uncharacterized protein n=1 Tax=Reticulomyxa filosa TaxID=46433 RepID=X6NHJ5_RETFI|nr:hypothetical protein RFI_11778 [Reticulomyxa filosa]|eukprot:ETO25358.1 hypothetical protein RFI_11778 [Reticulomyxa filosa]
MQHTSYNREIIAENVSHLKESLALLQQDLIGIDDKCVNEKNLLTNTRKDTTEKQPHEKIRDVTGEDKTWNEKEEEEEEVEENYTLKLHELRQLEKKYDEENRKLELEIAKMDKQYQELNQKMTTFSQQMSATLRQKEQSIEMLSQSQKQSKEQVRNLQTNFHQKLCNYYQLLLQCKQANSSENFRGLTEGVLQKLQDEFGVKTDKLSPLHKNFKDEMSLSYSLTFFYSTLQKQIEKE